MSASASTVEGAGRRRRRPSPALSFCWALRAWARELRPRNWSKSGGFRSLDRRPVARQRGQRHPARQSRQGDHAAAGSWCPIRWSTRWWRCVCSSPTPRTGTSWMAFPGLWGRPGGWMDVWRPHREPLPVIAVSIQVDYNRLLRRITGRRNCPVCQTNLQRLLAPSPAPTGFCDVDGTTLVQRADDTEAGLRGANARLRCADRAGCRTLPGSGAFRGSGWGPADRSDRCRHCCGCGRAEKAVVSYRFSGEGRAGRNTEGRQRED